MTGKNAELLPCPFCGEVPTVKERDGLASFCCPPKSTCMQSGVFTAFDPMSLLQAIRWWNRRALALATQDATSNARRRVSEIEDAIACGSMSAAQVFTQMRQLIPSAPQPQQQDDCVRVAVKMPEEFAQWFESQVPPGTVISNPRWWAPKIYRALLAAAKEPVAKPKPDPLSQALNEGDGVYRP